MSLWDPEHGEVRNPDPYDYGEAKRALARASRDVLAAATFEREAREKLAAAERAYRKALALRMVELRAEGVAATTCETLAKGEDRIADLRYHRDVAAGFHEAARHATYNATANRRAVDALVAWSMRVSPMGDQA